MITPFPKPLPRTPLRLRNRRRMTICIGIRTNDGIVIAADAQESDNYYKRAQQKIMPWLGGIQPNSQQPAQVACLFTGAGEGGYIDAFISDAINGLDHKMTGPQMQEYLRRCVLDFHRKHLFPLARVTDPPEISMLIACMWGFQPHFFVTHGSTLRSGFAYNAVGAGAHFAMSVIEDCPFPYTTKAAELIAAYVVAVTKGRIEGCGQHTAINTLHAPLIEEGKEGAPSRLVAAPRIMTHVKSSQIRRWEQIFDSNWTPRQRKALADLIEEELARNATETEPER
jgi:hypothetical protein